jgi:hypothetical protein
MKMPVIRVSDKTWERLKGYAIPLEDTPEDVLNRILDELHKLKSPAATAQPVIDVRPRASTERAKRVRGLRLPNKEFRRPLMEVVHELGGSASLSRIRPVMEERMAPRLREVDYELVSTGEPRWWNAICWERNDLVREGLFRDDSPRGTWALSERGIAIVEGRA